ncbi:MAG TPA: hypothetical protein VL463_24210 [Kofleriaceae bacterium]|nr:hypothetical protein [Kofleriaceae bacterium]
MTALLELTAAGEAHVPKVAHHFAAWGGIKEMLRVNGGRATEEQVIEVLKYCGHHDPKYQPNTAYLEYAIRSGWLKRI